MGISSSTVVQRGGKLMANNTLQSLMKSIVEKKIPKYSIFYGEELGVMKVYIDKMLEVTKATPFRADTLASIYPKLTRKRFSSDANFYIITADLDFLKQEKIWERMPSVVESSQDYVVLIYPSVDKRSKFYKNHTNSMIEFARMDIKVLSNYIKKEVQLSDAECQKLGDICDNDYSRILLECDKIRTLSNIKKISHSVAFNQLVEEGVIFSPIGDITFKLTDAILSADFANLPYLLYVAKLKKEPEILVLSILYNGFKHLLMVQSLVATVGRSTKALAEKTGLTSWQVLKALEKIDCYALPELVYNLKKVQEVEKGIKTGTIAIEDSINYLIVSILANMRGA